MKFKKVATIGLSLMISLGVVACNKEKKVDENSTKTKVETPKETELSKKDTAYIDKYSKFYGDYQNELANDKVYLSPQSIAQYYEKNEYPGNEKYLSSVKMAYKHAKDKTQIFVDNLKKDTKTEDANLKKMNEDLIKEGEKTIADIDTRMKNLDKIPADLAGKSKEEFMKAVDEATKVGQGTKNEFNKMLEDMNKALGIDTTNIKNQK